ncbi:MAG TPA: two-component regulator propeller domain-containing protein [Luteimonas sp.]
MPVLYRLRSVGALLLAATLACAPPARALDPAKGYVHYVRDTWSIQDGLPQITALCMAQDRDGYLWIGTQSGLARFDGVRFTSYLPQDTPALPAVWIRALLAGSDGRLWIGTYKGLAVRTGGEFRRILPADPGRWPALDVRALAETADHRILAATAEGLFEVRGERLHPLPGPEPALSLLARGDGLWVGTRGSVERIHAGRGLHLPLPEAHGNASVDHLVEAQGRIWAGTSAGLFALVGERWTPIPVDPAFDGSPVGAMLADRDGNLWVGSNGGLARFRGAVPVEFEPDLGPHAFRQVVSMLEDREGNFWLGSQLDGIARLWNGWTRRYGATQGLDDPIVWSVAPAADGGIWVGGNDGLSRFDGSRFTLVVPGKDLPHPHAYNLLAEGDTVWIGTRRGLVQWHGGKLVAPPQFAGMAGTQVYGILRAADGSLWFPTLDGLFHFADGVLQHHGRAQGLAEPQVRALLPGPGGTMLLGTQSGLYELRDGRARPRAAPGLPPGLDISAMYRLADGRLVLGSASERTWIEAGGRWHALGPAQGMPANTPFHFAEHGGYLYAAGIRGVARVPVADLPRDAGEAHVRGEMLLNERGDPNAGQRGFCCNGAGLAKGFLRDGVLWLPTRDGIVALDTDAIRKNPVPPQVVIERLRTPSGWRPLQSGAGPLELAAGDRDLGFEFTALSFQDPRSVQLRYRLIGYDRAWHLLEDARRRSANYTNLPPGDYRFEVAAANNAGEWSTHAAALGFRILPRFHETWLFRVLMGALLATLAYALFRHQQQRYARQRAQLAQEVQSRTLELNVAKARLEKASQTDPMTGLRNERYLANQVPADLAFYERDRKRSDGFDQSLGLVLVEPGTREPGALVEVAQLLASLVRGSDYVARWGDGFLLVLRPLPDHRLETIGERIRDAFAGQRFPRAGAAAAPLDYALGMVEYPLRGARQQGVGWEQMVELADVGLRWVHARGGHGWVLLRPSSHADLPRLLQGLSPDDLEGLLRAGRLHLRASPGLGLREGAPA